VDRGGAGRSHGTGLAAAPPRAQAAWPRIGFGIALLVFCAALALQLAVDLGSGHSSLQLRLHRGINAGSQVGLRTMVACYLAALAVSGWGAWKLLRRDGAGRWPATRRLSEVHEVAGQRPALPQRRAASLLSRAPRNSDSFSHVGQRRLLASSAPRS
jgi:hypothetical protein